MARPLQPVDRMKSPHVLDQPVLVPVRQQLLAPLATCKGAEFIERRSTALIRLLVDTGSAPPSCSGWP